MMCSSFPESATLGAVQGRSIEEFIAIHRLNWYFTRLLGKAKTAEEALSIICEDMRDWPKEVLTFFCHCALKDATAFTKHEREAQTTEEAEVLRRRSGTKRRQLERTVVATQQPPNQRS